MSVKIYWVAATFIHFHIVHGCLNAKWQSWVVTAKCTTLTTWPFAEKACDPCPGGWQDITRFQWRQLNKQGGWLATPHQGQKQTRRLSGSEHRQQQGHQLGGAGSLTPSLTNLCVRLKRWPCAQWVMTQLRDPGRWLITFNNKQHTSRSFSPGGWVAIRWSRSGCLDLLSCLRDSRQRNLKVRSSL